MEIDWFWALLLGYALGSIPFGLLLAHAAGKGDIRKIGSGNIGATNVLRTGGKGLAAATLLLDTAKGFVPVILAGDIWWRVDGHDQLHGLEPLFGYGFDWQVIASPEAAAALGAVLGHCFPVWLGFRGGKGVATNAGVSFGLGLPIGLVYAGVWLGLLASTRISSLAGMGAVLAAAIAAAVFGYFAFVPVLSLIALIVVVLHRQNLARLRAGTEPKVGRKKSGSER